jgi:hypothetical protein
MINKITIENFKSIKDRVEIDLKPITLLFGPNSAGKSTVIQALHYLKEILERNNTDPGKTELGGDAVDLGGFANLVHREEGDSEDHYKYKTIKIGIEIEEDDFRIPELYDDDERFKHAQLLLQNAGYEPYFLEFSIEWDKDLKRPIVKKYDISISGIIIGSIKMAGWNVDDISDQSDIGNYRFKRHVENQGRLPRFILSKINFVHPALMWMNDTIDDEIDRPDLSLDYCFQVLDQFLEIKPNSDKLSLFLYYRDSAIPSLAPISLRHIQIDLTNLSVSDENKALAAGLTISTIELTLTHIFTTPLQMLMDEFKVFRYIGPLRTIPERLFQPRLMPEEKRWSDGLGAWDILYQKLNSVKKWDKDFLARVNKWMGYIDTGYSISIKNYKEIDAENPLYMGLDSDGRFIEDGEELRQALEKIPSKTRITMHEEKNHIDVTAQDIGTGIAQVFPIIVAAADWDNEFLTVEQPELHIHPAIQQKLADVIIACYGEARLVILETHSEHIMLRLLRRIEETTNNELTSPEFKLRHDEVSVIYVEPKDAGVEMTQLPIDETGEFTRNWPRGFFEEREEDIF